MADEISPEARMAVAAAFAYAGPMGQYEGQWRTKFEEGLMRAAAAMNGKPAWDAQAVIEGDVFSGAYQGYDYEESSTRCIVKISSGTGRSKDKDNDGLERIRTDRTDRAFGERMRKRLDDVPLGSKILVWKVLEKMSTGDEKVRVMKHFEVLQLNRDSASKQAGAPPAAPPDTEAGAPPAQVAPASTNAEWQPVLDRVQALSNKAKVAFVQQCRAEKLNWMNPVEGEERIKKILSEMEKM